MKKVMMISLLALSMTASAKGWPVDTLHQASVNNPFLQRLTPTLTTDYVQVGKINQHWFFGIQGGASAFIGKLHSMPILASGSHQTSVQGCPSRD